MGFIFPRSAFTADGYKVEGGGSVSLSDDVDDAGDSGMSD